MDRKKLRKRLAKRQKQKARNFYQELPCSSPPGPQFMEPGLLIEKVWEDSQKHVYVRLSNGKIIEFDSDNQWVKEVDAVPLTAVER